MAKWEFRLNRVLRSFVDGCLASLPVSVRNRLLPHLLTHVTEATKFRCGIPTMAGLLGNLKENGFVPATIVDVGANVGSWTRLASALFPAARLFLFDGDPVNKQHLDSAVQDLGDRASYRISLLGPEEKEQVVFFQLGAGSSVLRELTSFEPNQVTLPMTTLDAAVTGNLGSPVLLKLDVQGYELEVLRGGPSVLKSSDVVIMETALLPYNENSPMFADVIHFMQDSGFVVYDFCGQARRETDQALFQTDVVFVRGDSPLRAARKFFLREP